MEIAKNIITGILLLNAIFWGIASHSSHCAFVKMIPNMKSCPPHWVHLMMGIMFYLMAVFVSQYEYITKMKSN